MQRCRRMLRRFGAQVAPSARRTASLLLGALFLPLFVSCDTGAIFYFIAPKYSGSRMVSTVPVKIESDGSFTRVCQGDGATGLLLNVVHVSTKRTPPTASANISEDRDLSIHPLDVIDGPEDGNDARVVNGDAPDDIRLSATANFDLDVECLNPVSASAPNLQGCVGHNGAVGLESIEHTTFQQRRRNGHDVVIIVDQSGSTLGFVDSTDFREKDDPEIFGQFSDNASDYNRLRFAAIKSFIAQLNAEDRLGILAFGRSGELFTPCADATGNYANDLKQCFGRNRDLWVSPGSSTGFDSMLEGQFPPEGRANLWEAISEAYAFLDHRFDDETFFDQPRNESATAPPTKHIVVITDGPDTCVETEDMNDCDSLCSTTDHEDVIALIEAMQERSLTEQGVVPIQIHFVQFESKGYPGRDPRQIEAACLSEGHYQFVNSNTLSVLNNEPFEQALKLAMTNVRYSLMGYWSFALDVPYYFDNTVSNGSPPGTLYALSGSLTVQRATYLHPTDRTWTFGVGQGDGADQASTWDRRPTVRKPCLGDTLAVSDGGCGAAAQSDGCTIYCSTQTSTCPAGSSGVEAPSAITQCTTDGGSSGICCGGGCQDGTEFCNLCSP